MKIAFSIGVAALSAVSFAQFSDNFESGAAAAGGTLLTNGFGGGGQNGWYNPVSGSLDGSLYTYTGNTLGFAPNPNGQNQFLGQDETVAQTPVRSQHDMSFGSGGVWKISFDFNGNFNGTLPTADNLGSVSIQPSATADYFQTIYQWGSNTATASGFGANIGHWTSAGGAGGAGIVFDSPGTAWTNLVLNHWYHQTVTWDFGSGLITDTTLQDITAGGSLNDFQPTGWYLSGGAANILGQPLPTAVRFFASGGAGDLMGYDNLNVAPVPEPASLAALGIGALALIRRRKANR